MREEDHINSSSHLELGHVYDRLSRLETEVKEVREGQHRMEVAITSKPRFPAWAAGIILTLGLQTATAIWWASGINKEVSDLPALEMRLTSAFQGMRNNDTVIANMQSEQTRLRTEMDNIQRRTIEGTDDRWRKRDDEARMAELHRYLDTRFGEIFKRIEVEEKRSTERDLLWQQLYARGTVKGITK